MPNSVIFGSRPSISTIFLYSSSVRLCCAMRFLVITGAGTITTASLTHHSDNVCSEESPSWPIHIDHLHCATRRLSFRQCATMPVVPHGHLAQRFFGGI